MHAAGVERLRATPLESRSGTPPGRPSEVVSMNDVTRILSAIEHGDPQAARLVKLRYFAGLSHQQAAQALGVGRRAADRLWSLARAWLYQRLSAE